MRQHPPTVRPIAVHVTVLDEPLSLTEQERQHFERFFAAASALPLSQDVLEQAVKLRQLRKMTLGDALVAGTALMHGLTLVTRNIDDFKWIAGLSILNPFTLEPQ